eukprot:9688569-Prorocentrum_lima.AAC.1
MCIRDSLLSHHPEAVQEAIFFSIGRGTVGDRALVHAPRTTRRCTTRLAAEPQPQPASPTSSTT